MQEVQIIDKPVLTRNTVVGYFSIVILYTVVYKNVADIGANASINIANDITLPEK